MAIDNRLDFCEQSYESLFSEDVIIYGVNLIIDSIAPPFYGANGELNLESILSSLNVLVIFCWFSLFNACLISRSALTNFVPLLLLIKRGFP